MKLHIPREIALALLLLVVAVAGHGWLVSPVPSSGGGLGTGNASTQSPCGNFRGKTPTATFSPGATATIQYMRANSHGVTGPTVNFTISASAATGTNTPTSNDFTGANIVLQKTGVTMDVSLSSPQSTTMTMPTTPGVYAIQFRWNPTSGGSWFDCAFVSVVADGPCTTNNGGCDAHADCSVSSTNTAVCTCKPSYFGDGHTCSLLPSAKSIVLLANSTSGTGFQDQFTTDIAKFLNIPSSRILYDSAVNLNSTNLQGQVDIYFSIIADPSSGQDATAQVNTLINTIASGNDLLHSYLGFPVQAITVDGGATYTYGGGTGSSSTLSPGGAAGVAIAVIVVSAAIAAGVWYKFWGPGARKDGSASSKIPQAQPKAQPFTGVSLAPVAQPRSAAGPSTNTTAGGSSSSDNIVVGWGEYKDASGRTYFFNSLTGESRWERPAEMH